MDQPQRSQRKDNALNSYSHSASRYSYSVVPTKFAYVRNLSDGITLISSTSTDALSTSRSTIFHGNVSRHQIRASDVSISHAPNRELWCTTLFRVISCFESGSVDCSRSPRLDVNAMRSEDVHGSSSRNSVANARNDMPRHTAIIMKNGISQLRYKRGNIPNVVVNNSSDRSESCIISSLKGNFSLRSSTRNGWDQRVVRMICHCHSTRSATFVHFIVPPFYGQ